MQFMSKGELKEELYARGVTPLGEKVELMVRLLCDNAVLMAAQT